MLIVFKGSSREPTSKERKMENRKVRERFMACLEVWKKEEKQSKGRESNSITLLGSFLRNEEERFGGVSTNSNPSFLIPPNWRDLEGE